MFATHTDGQIHLHTRTYTRTQRTREQRRTRPGKNERLVTGTATTLLSRRRESGEVAAAAAAVSSPPTAKHTSSSSSSCSVHRMLPRRLLRRRWRRRRFRYGVQHVRWAGRRPSPPCVAATRVRFSTNARPAFFRERVSSALFGFRVRCTRFDRKRRDLLRRRPSIVSWPIVTCLNTRVVREYDFSINPASRNTPIDLHVFPITRSSVSVGFLRSARVQSSVVGFRIFTKRPFSIRNVLE